MNPTTSKVIYVDIDNTICFKQTIDCVYDNAIPNPTRIAQINSLYEAGHRIVYWTARGTVTGIDWRPVTESQLQRWGCLYHALKMGKPAFDLFIDDKAILANNFFGTNQSKKIGGLHRSRSI